MNKFHDLDLSIPNERVQITLAKLAHDGHDVDENCRPHPEFGIHFIKNYDNKRPKREKGNPKLAPRELTPNTAALGTGEKAAVFQNGAAVLGVISTVYL